MKEKRPFYSYDILTGEVDQHLDCSDFNRYADRENAFSVKSVIEGSKIKYERYALSYDDETFWVTKAQLKIARLGAQSISPPCYVRQDANPAENRIEYTPINTSDTKYTALLAYISELQNKIARLNEQIDILRDEIGNPGTVGSNRKRAIIIESAASSKVGKPWVPEPGTPAWNVLAAEEAAKKEEAA